MKKKNNSEKKESSSSGLGTAIAVIGGIAIGALGALIGTKVIPELFDTPEEEKKTEKPKKIVIDPSTENTLSQIESFYDPITSTLFTDPQVTTCGHTFEKQLLIEWIKKSGTCPTCRKKLGLNSFVPNYQLRDAILQTSQKTLK